MGYDEFDLAHGRSIASEKMDSFVRKTAEMLEGKKFNNVKSAVKVLENYCIFRVIRLKKVYFTGMFTSNQGDLSVQYYDPESRRVRQYYPELIIGSNCGEMFQYGDINQRVSSYMDTAMLLMRNL